MNVQDFEIIGWELINVSVAVNRAFTLIHHLAEDEPMFCIEAHFQDFGGVKHLAEVISSSRFACYCWGKISGRHELVRSEFAMACNARWVFGNTSIQMESGFGHGLPTYDWDGRPPELLTVRLTRKHPKPLKAKDRKPSPVTVKLCMEAAEEAINGKLHEPVKTVTEWMDGDCIHNYLVTAPVTRAISLVSNLCSVFGLENGVGSYEFLGEPSQLEGIQQSGHYRFTNFPPDCWSWNAQFKTPFALAAHSFLCPVPNVEGTRLPIAASVLDELGNRVAHCVIVKKYLAWKLGANEFSPRTAGNYLLISRQKAGCAMFVGFEQYADADPSAKQFTTVATPVVEQIGIKLKKVSNIRCAAPN